MHHRPRRFAFALCGILVSPVLPVATAQDAPAPAATETRPLPTAEAIHAKMIDFMGGREAFAEIGPVESIGTFSVPAAQMNGTMKTWTAPPNFMKVEVELPGIGTSLTGFDGTVGWSIDPVRGASLMDGEMLAQIKDEANSTAELDLLKRYDSATVTGREVFEGVECVVLKLVRGKTVEERFIVEDTGELKGRRAKAPSPMGEIPTITVNEAWKTIGKHKVPSRIVMKMMGMEQVMTIDEIKSEELPADTFALPPAIKALVEKRNSESASESNSAQDASSASSSSSDSASSSSSKSSKSSSSSSSSKSSKSSNSSSSGSSKSSKSSGSSGSSRNSGSSSSSSSRGGRGS